MERKKAALHNLGCKVNAYETEAMQQILEENGYEIVPFAPGADLYLINTCTVTNIADRKSRQMLHKARKMNPKAIVVAAGCYVQASAEELAADGSVDVAVSYTHLKRRSCCGSCKESRSGSTGSDASGRMGVCDSAKKLGENHVPFFCKS